MSLEPPPGPHPDKGRAVAAMFERIAPRYDLMNRLLSLGLDQRWRAEAARLALADAPASVLDVATGTGDLALMLARAGAEVVGVDLSKAMLELARRKAARAGLHLRFEHADALALPFDAASFDAVTVAYGVRNFADVATGLRELRRVLARGGRLVVLEFPPPDERIVGRALRWYGRSVMPTIGAWVSGDRGAYAYLPASTLAFLPPERFAELLGATGFAAVRYRLQTFGASALFDGVAA